MKLRAAHVTSVSPLRRNGISVACTSSLCAAAALSNTLHTL